MCAPRCGLLLFLSITLSPLSLLPATLTKGWTTTRWPWLHYLPGLLLQLLLALCFFYLCVSHVKPMWSPNSGGHCSGLSHHSSQWVGRAGVFQGAPCQAIVRPPAHLPLLLLLWMWPFNTPVALSRCSELCPGTAECQLTINCSMSQRVPSGGCSPHASLRGQHPPSLRPLSQHCVWFNVKPPGHYP